MKLRGYVGSYGEEVVSFTVKILDPCITSITVSPISNKEYDIYTGGNLTISSQFNVNLGNCPETLTYTLDD